MSRLDEIEARLDAARAAASDRWEVDGLSTDGGYAVVATDAMDVRTDGYLPEEAAEMFAHAPADLAALVAVVRAVEQMEHAARVLARQAAADGERASSPVARAGHAARQLGHEATAAALRVALDGLEAS